MNKYNYTDIEKIIKRFNETGKQLNQYRGICFTQGKWRASFQKKILGLFEKLTEAIEVYDNFIIKTFGEKAITNEKLIKLNILPLPINNVIYILVEDLPGEIWKDITNYEGIYKISNMGRIKSINIRKNLERGDFLREFGDCKGYHVINLTKDGKSKTFRVNRLVAQTFLENPNDFLEVNHKNLDKLNNTVENLEWCNQEHNLKHAYDNGVYKHIDYQNLAAKINMDIANEIREMYKTKKYTQKEVGEKFGLHRSTISCIINETRWKINIKQ